MLKLISEVDSICHRLEEIFRELRKDETMTDAVYNKLTNQTLDILKTAIEDGSTEENNCHKINERSELKLPVEEIHKVAHLTGEHINSYFPNGYCAKMSTNNRNSKTEIYDDVILGLLCANHNKNRIKYEHILNEFHRVGLAEDRNTTYGRISRLRKEKSISPYDKNNKSDRSIYSLTDEGLKVAQKMLKERGLLHLLSVQNIAIENC